MSTTIDSRIVEMQFNNREFETNIKTSLSTIDKLKQSLNFTGASKGLENISAVSRKVDMAEFSGALDTVRVRFSALETMAVTALANITNSAVNAGKRIVSALTIKPVMEGFAEYELKMGSVQTIMAGTGESLDSVNKYLEELNKYADRTIYSFRDMTSNIGKFTNAGVSLKDSVSAIQGISNVAAVSGANANEASRAMYNFAQALSAGHVKLIDWKSIENANMATVEFKNQLLETALASGTVSKAANGMYTTLDGNSFNATKNFNDVLKDQWMTTEVLVKTLGRYSDETTAVGKKAFAAAQDVKTLSQLFDTLKEAAGSGWAQTWELIIGDFDEAKNVLTDLNKVIGGFLDRVSDSRNELLKFWKENGGRDDLINSIRKSFELFGQIIKPISDAFNYIFSPITGRQLVGITSAIKAFVENLKIGEGTANKIKRTFGGLFAVLDMIKDAFWLTIKVASEAFSWIGGPIVSGLLELTARLGDFLMKVHGMVDAGNIFEFTFLKIQNIFTTVADKIKEAISRIGEAFKGFRSIDIDPLGDLAELSVKRLQPFTRLGDIFRVSFEAVVKVLEWIAPIAARLGSIVGSALGALADKVSYSVENMEFSGILDIINTGLFGAILLGIKKFIDSLTKITSGAGGFLDGVKGIIDGVRGSLEAFQSSLKAKTLMTIATAIAILAASLLVLSFIDSKKLTVSLVAISALFAELSATMIILNKSLNGIKMAKITSQLIAMSAAILILSFAMKNLASLDWEGVGKGVVGIGSLSAILVIAANKLDKSSGKLIKGSMGLVAFSAAIVILTHAVEKLSKLSWDELGRGLLGLTVILTEIVILTRNLGDPKRMISTSVGLIALGVATLIFATAIEKLGKLSWDEIVKGLVSMGGALFGIAAGLGLMPNDVISKSAGLVILGGALLIIANAMSKFGSMSWEEIVKGLVAMGGALFGIAAAMGLMPDNMIIKALGLIGVATALQIMIGPLTQMAGMSWDEIVRGLSALGGSLLIISLAMNKMTTGLPGAAAMLVMAAALRVFVPALVTLGNMDIIEIGKALLTLVGVFAIVGISASLLAPLTPVILTLAASIAILGIGVMAVGAGLLMFSAGITALAVSGTAGAAALVIVVTSLISLIPMIIQKLGEGIIAFAKVIVNGLPVIMEAVKQIALALIRVISDVTVPIVKALMKFVVTLIKELANSVPQMVDAGMKLLFGILEGIGAHIQDVVEAALDIIDGFLAGIAEGLPGVVSSAVDVVSTFLISIGQELPKIIDAGFKMIVNFVNGLSVAIRENAPIVGEAMGNLAIAMVDGLVLGIMAGIGTVVNSVMELGKSALDGLKNFLGIHSPSKEFEELGMYTSEGFAKGVSGEQGNITSTISGMSAKMIQEIRDSIPKFTEAGSSVMTAFINGLKLQDVNSKLASTTIISGCLTMIKNRYNDFKVAGQDLVNQLITGIKMKSADLSTAFIQLVNRSVLEVRNKYVEFYNAGSYLVQGFADGIRANTYLAEARARSMASAAARAASRALDINSPSRVGYSIGGFFGQGFVNAIVDYTSKAGKAGAGMAESAKNGLSNAISKISTIIDEGIDTQPTIRPVLDLSNIESGTSRLNSLFSRTQALSINAVPNREPINEPQSEMNNPVNANTYSFAQYNYSPKALSRLDIYRQTKNQFSLMKGLVTSR